VRSKIIINEEIIEQVSYLKFLVCEMLILNAEYFRNSGICTETIGTQRKERHAVEIPQNHGSAMPGVWQRSMDF
jgi:hypothetical protein